MSFRLRKFTKKDIAPLFEWFQSEREVLQWAGAALSWPLQRREFLELVKLQRGAAPVREVWAVMLYGDMAAHFQISFNRRLNTAGLGRIAIAPKYRGQGFALEELVVPSLRFAASPPDGGPALAALSAETRIRVVAAVDHPERGVVSILLVLPPFLLHLRRLLGLRLRLQLLKRCT